MKNLLSPCHVAARRSRRYKTRPNTEFVFGRARSTTRNVGPRSPFKSGFLLSAYAPPFFLALQHRTEPYFDTGGFPAQLLALHREISTTRWLHEIFVVPLKDPYSVSPRQDTCWETNFCAGMIALHLKFVIWHRPATRFRNSQGGMKTLHDEPWHFGWCSHCLIFFICSDHVWNQSYCSQEYHSAPLSAK